MAPFAFHAPVKGDLVPLRLSELRLDITARRRTAQKGTFSLSPFRSDPIRPLRMLGRSIILDAIAQALDVSRPKGWNADDQASTDRWTDLVNVTAQNRLRGWTASARTRVNSTAQNSVSYRPVGEACAALRRYEALHFLAVVPGPVCLWAEAAGLDCRAISRWAAPLLLAHEARYPRQAYCHLAPMGGGRGVRRAA